MHTTETSANGYAIQRHDREFYVTLNGTFLDFASTYDKALELMTQLAYPATSENVIKARRDRATRLTYTICDRLRTQHA